MLIGLNFIMLHVPDVEQARAFYTEKLGLVVDAQQPDFVQFKQPMGHGAVFALGKAEDNATLQGAELVSKPTDEPFGRALAIKDPAGHTIHLLQLPSQR